MIPKSRWLYGTIKDELEYSVKTVKTNHKPQMIYSGLIYEIHTVNLYEKIDNKHKYQIWINLVKKLKLDFEYFLDLRYIPADIPKNGLERLPNKLAAKLFETYHETDFKKLNLDSTIKVVNVDTVNNNFSICKFNFTVVRKRNKVRLFGCIKYCYPKNI